MSQHTSSQKFLARVWRDFKGRRAAFASLCMVIAMGVVALSADFIANEKPYYIEVEGEGYFPAFIDYGVWLGLRNWPRPLLNADFKRLAEKSQSVIFAPIPYSPERVDIRGEVFANPSAEHLLGTDRLGRDVAAGLIHGTRISLTIGLVVVAIQATIGILLGGLAGYYGGWVDIAISRFIEMMLGIPTFFILITVAAIFPPSIFLIMVILGVTGWTGIARYIRSEFLRVRAMEFVEAARSLGSTDARVMFRHILPNAIAPVLVAMAFGVAGAIMAESSLSFLGIGVPAHVVTWGSILAEARANTFAWWLAVFPGLAIFVTVTAYNLLGDGLRDAMDPRVTGG
ncbi:MAG: ABC transporter permease [bacterium]|nr:ABC transporter permease [bacterium]